MRKFRLEQGRTGQWDTWDLRLITHSGEEVMPLFIRSDEVDRVVSDIEIALLTVMNRSKNVTQECMGERIKSCVRSRLPRTCHLTEWMDVQQAE